MTSSKIYTTHPVTKGNGMGGRNTTAGLADEEKREYLSKALKKRRESAGRRGPCGLH